LLNTTWTASALRLRTTETSLRRLYLRRRPSDTLRSSHIFIILLKAIGKQFS